MRDSIQPALIHTAATFSDHSFVIYGHFYGDDDLSLILA